MTRENINSAISRTFDFLKEDGFGGSRRETVREWLDSAYRQPGELSDSTTAALDILRDLGFENEIVMPKDEQESS